MLKIFSPCKFVHYRNKNAPMKAFILSLFLFPTLGTYTQAKLPFKDHEKNDSIVLKYDLLKPEIAYFKTYCSQGKLIESILINGKSKVVFLSKKKYRAGQYKYTYKFEEGTFVVK